LAFLLVIAIGWRRLASTAAFDLLRHCAAWRGWCQRAIDIV